MIDLRISNLILYIFLTFIVSSSIVFNSIYFDLTLISCLIIYVSRWSETNWIICIVLFLLGIYNDILVSSPFGYASMLFLCFYLIDRVRNYLSLPFNTVIKFTIFSLLMISLFSLNYFTIYFIYNASIPLFINIIPYIVVILLYFPLHFIISYIQNKYVRIK